MQAGVRSAAAEEIHGPGRLHGEGDDPAEDPARILKVATPTRPTIRRANRAPAKSRALMPASTASGAPERHCRSETARSAAAPINRRFCGVNCHGKSPQRPVANFTGPADSSARRAADVEGRWAFAGPDVGSVADAFHFARKSRRRVGFGRSSHEEDGLFQDCAVRARAGGPDRARGERHRDFHRGEPRNPHGRRPDHAGSRPRRRRECAMAADIAAGCIMAGCTEAAARDTLAARIAAPA